jgi:hypothetical protein
MERRCLKLVAFKVDRLQELKTKLSGSVSRKLKKTWASQGRTRAVQQPGRAPIPKPGGAPSRRLKDLGQRAVPQPTRLTLQKAKGLHRIRDLQGGSDQCKDSYNRNILTHPLRVCGFR